VRQLLNHTSGWLGDDLQDLGRGDDALARYLLTGTQDEDDGGIDGGDVRL
jgi:hypothetical protein